MTDNSWRHFDEWIHTAEGRKAMNGYDENLEGCPECAICGNRTNSEMDIRRYWEPCSYCEKWICANHSAKYCGSACRAAGRKSARNAKK